MSVMTNIDKEMIKSLLEEIKNATEFNDKDYWRHTLRKIDNLPRDLKIKMIADLCEYWESK